MADPAEDMEEDNDHDVGAEAEVHGGSIPPRNELAAAPPSESQRDGNEGTELGKRDAQSLEEGGAGAVDGGSKRRKKQKTQLPYHEYRAMTQFIAIHLRQQEETAGAEFVGCKWGDIVAWYLHQYQRELTDEEEFESRRKVVSQVLRRMLKHEEAIVEVVPPGADVSADTPNEERMLKLHPSYEISS